MIVKAHDELMFDRKESFFTGKITTRNKPYTTEVLVGEIPISTYFGTDVLAFHEKYKNLQGDFTFNCNIKIEKTSFPILKETYKFKKDGVSIKDRAIELDDIIQVYVTVQVGVEYEAKKLGTSERYQLDVNPTPGHRYHVAEDNFKDFIPTNTDEAVYEPKEHESLELLSKMTSIYLVPYRLRMVNYDETKPNEIMKNTYSYNTIHHTFDDKMFIEGEKEYDPTLFEIAKVAIQSTKNIERDTIMLDLRNRGGGIKENISKNEIKETDQMSLFNWDIGYFDGEAYQENGVVVIRVADTILDGVNDEAIKEDILKQAFNKYKAFGVLPIIEFYSVGDTKRELLQNKGFTQKSPYWNEKLSKGVPSILKDENSEYMVEINDDESLVYRVPGYLFEEGVRYKLEIKAKLKNEFSKERSSGLIAIKYKNVENKTVINLPQLISVDEWLQIEEEFKVTAEVQYVDLILNNSEEKAIGQALFKDVFLTSKGYDVSNEEIIEL